jgi:uncharacterized protein YndB with AHSA1/START domain
MIDFVNQIKAIHREVNRSGETVQVVLRREYDASVEDVWDAITDPDRVKRWFLPLRGDLRVGGSFQLEGNAGGEILQCDPPRLLRVTFGGPSSIVELRLTEYGADRTSFELEHTVPIEMAGSGAGALYVGPGWDGAVMGLGLFLSGQTPDDPVAMASSAEGQEFSRQSVHAWLAVVESSGTANEDEIAAATQVSLAQFSPDLPR